MSPIFKHFFIILSCFWLVNFPCASESFKDRMSEYKKQQNKNYNNFKSDYQARYSAFKKELLKKWGVAEVSSKKEYIHYSEDLNTKVVMNFETNTLEISLQNKHEITKEQNQKQVKTAILEALNSTPEEIVKSNIQFESDDKLNISSSVQIAIPKQGPQSVNTISDNSILSYIGIKNEQQLDHVIASFTQIPKETYDDLVIERSIARKFDQISALANFSSQFDQPAPEINETISSLSEEVASLKSADRQAAVTSTNAKSYQAELPSKRLKNAEKFLSDIRENADKWQLTNELVLAIIETESNFFPLAKSYIPAYGLMQIVPSTAGMDVNNKIFHLSHKPSPELLYKSADNIKYGTAYLNILNTQYLEGITNEKSKLYCVIASYNTGIGNLAKAFNKGKKGRKKAIETINTLTPEEVYSIIKKRTHTETQRYLDKVLKSQAYFHAQKV